MYKLSSMRDRLEKLRQPPSKKEKVKLAVPTLSELGIARLATISGT